MEAVAAMEEGPALAAAEVPEDEDGPALEAAEARVND